MSCVLLSVTYTQRVSDKCLTPSQQYLAILWREQVTLPSEQYLAILWGQIRDYKIGICCFSSKHAALRRKRKNWLAQTQGNVFEWSDISTCRLLLQ
jgi:hypothetical protein